MSKIKKLFEKKQSNILSVYFTAGYPQLEDTNEIIQALVNEAVDMIEIGMPYSDPVADGPVIQDSSQQALENGMTIKKLFDQLKILPTEAKNIPLILMGYMNPVMQFGFENFCKEAAACGVSGMIIPDLPLREFEMEYKPITDKFHLDFIFLITPETTEQRIRHMDDLSDSFLYAVSSSSTTGSETDLHQMEKYFKRLQSMDLKNPFLIGFGIRNRDTFLQACKYANGGIIGTAFINELKKPGTIEEKTRNFVDRICS